MPIKSYLAHPHNGKKNELIQALSAIDQCEVVAAQNKEVLVLVTETENTTEEDILKEKLETIDSLKLLALVSGFNTPKNN
ncbi:chaperone NapD [Aquimarina sp. 2304DJ70-9]|uniref:chaperone NapD n=1 Tax=Aquimarina penaris TaxID=3231044 RepID=UPI0034633CED